MQANKYPHSPKTTTTQRSRALDIGVSTWIPIKATFFHINIKNLPKHFDDLDLYLNSLGYTFSFVGLTETWLDESKHDLFDLPGYNCVNRFRKGKKGGGATFCLRYGIPYTIRDDLQWNQYL